MGNLTQSQGRGARLSHPVLTLLIAAVAAIGAISQCGLLLDAASTSRSAAGTSPRALSSRPATAAQSPQVAAATRSAVSSANATRPN